MSDKDLQDNDQLPALAQELEAMRIAGQPPPEEKKIRFLQLTLRDDFNEEAFARVRWLVNHGVEDLQVVNDLIRMFDERKLRRAFDALPKAQSTRPGLLEMVLSEPEPAMVMSLGGHPMTPEELEQYNNTHLNVVEAPAEKKSALAETLAEALQQEPEKISVIHVPRPR